MLPALPEQEVVSLNLSNPVTQGNARPLDHGFPRRSMISRHEPRPFRSSPLAGPALSGQDNEMSKICSESLIAPPSPALLKCERRSRVMFVDEGTVPKLPFPHHIRRPRTAPELSDASKHLSRPQSFSRASSGAPVQPSIVQPVVLNRPRAPSTSRAPSENWLSTNPYETTPRFSRLSLATEGIVLPVSAREYKSKKLSHSSSRASIGSMRSITSITTNSPPRRAISFIDEIADEETRAAIDGLSMDMQSLPSLTRTSSRGSSEGPATPSTASIASTGSVGVRVETKIADDPGFKKAMGANKGILGPWDTLRSFGLGSTSKVEGVEVVIPPSRKSFHRLSLPIMKPPSVSDMDKTICKERSQPLVGSIRKVWKAFIGTGRK